MLIYVNVKRIQKRDGRKYPCSELARAAKEVLKRVEK